MWVKGIAVSREFSLVEEEISDRKSFSSESSQWGGKKITGKEVQPGMQEKEYYRDRADMWPGVKSA